MSQHCLAKKKLFNAQELNNNRIKARRLYSRSAECVECFALFFMIDLFFGFYCCQHFIIFSSGCIKKIVTQYLTQINLFVIIIGKFGQEMSV